MNKSMITVVCIFLSLVISNVYLNDLRKIKERSISLIEMSAKDKSYIDISNIEGSALYTKYDIVLASTFDRKVEKIEVQNGNQSHIFRLDDPQSLIYSLDDVAKNKKFNMTMNYNSVENVVIPSFE